MNPTPSKSTRNILAFLVLLAVLVGVYWGVWQFQFVWDDYQLFVIRPEFRTELWPQAIFSAFPVSENYFRPLVLATFVAELHIYDVSSGPMHLTNLVLHIVNTILVGVLARQAGRAFYGEARLMPFVCAALYGVHPALVESTAWISGRFDLMVTTFSLAGLALSLGPLTARRITTVCACFLAAAFSKEMAAVLPLLIILWRWLHSEERPADLRTYLRSNEMRLFIALVGVGAAYLIIRVSSIGHLVVDDARLQAANLLDRLLLIGKAYAWYAWIAVLPFSQSAPLHEAKTPIPPTDLMAWGGLAGLMLVTAITGFAVLRHRNILMGLLLAYSLALVPVLHILKPLTISDNIVHERFLTLPLAFLAIAVGSAAYRTTGWARQHGLRLTGPTVTTVLGIWFAWALFNAHLGAQFWRSNVTFWHWAAQKSPNSGFALSNLATSHLDRGEYEAALEPARRATELEPWRIPAQANYAIALMGLGRYEEARRLFEEIAVKHGENSGLNNNQGVLALDMKDETRARHHFERAVELDPQNWRALSNLSRLESRAGNVKRAEQLLQQAQKWAPPGAIVVGESASPVSMPTGRD